MVVTEMRRSQRFSLCHIQLQYPLIPYISHLLVNESASSRLPHPLDSLRDTDVIGLELVQTHKGEHGEAIEQPEQTVAHAGHAPLGEVVGDAGLEADVRVSDDEGAEDGVSGRVEGGAREGGDGDGDQGGGDESLGGPVVGAVGWGGFWDGSGVVRYLSCGVSKCRCVSSCARRVVIAQARGQHTCSLDALCIQVSNRSRPTAPTAIKVHTWQRRQDSSPPCSMECSHSSSSWQSIPYEL